MKVRFTSIILMLCLISTTLISCVPSREFLKMKEEGYYPDTNDFPNTKWVCREVDMYFYIFDKGEDYFVGEYVDGDNVYRILGSFGLWGTLDFELYSSEVAVLSSSYTNEKGELYANCSSERQGVICTEYIYEKGVIVCTVRYTEQIECKEKTLTFEKVDEIAQTVNECWKCEELNIQMYSYSDIAGYYKGQMIIDGQECIIQAFEVADNYYMFSIENGKLNNAVKGTSRLIDMYFEYDEGKIIAKITDAHIRDPLSYTLWPYEITQVTFVKQE